MGAYGVGNIVAALLLGNMQRKNPERMVYIDSYGLVSVLYL